MLFFQPTRGSPTPDKPRRRVPGGGLAGAALPLFVKKASRTLLTQKKALSLHPICACGEIGRRARLRIWWFRPCRFESYQAHRCSFTKKATTYTASPPGKPCKLLPLFVQLPWKAAMCCLCCRQNNKNDNGNNLYNLAVVSVVLVVVKIIRTTTETTCTTLRCMGCPCCRQNNKTRQRKQLVQPCVVSVVCVGVKIIRTTTETTCTTLRCMGCLCCRQ